MMRIAGVAVLILVLAMGFARAQTVVTYDSTIVDAFGGHAEHFPIGERVVISYVIDASPDGDPDPTRGIYPDSVVAMWVSFPDLEHYAICGPSGLATTTNNAFTTTGLVDGASFRSGSATESTQIGGDFVSRVEVEFDDVPTGGVEPTMLSSDALPLSPLSTQFSYLMIWTDPGPMITQIKFSPPTTPVTVTYDAIVESAMGPHATLFPAGERIRISYTLSRNAVDRNTADPNHANYRNVVLNFNVTFPDLGIFGNAGPPHDWTQGQIYITNDFAFPPGRMTDQVTLWLNPVGSTSLLDGERVTFMTLGFHDFPAAPAASTMISSDELPLGKLRASDPYVHFETSSGNTFVKFVLAPSEQVRMLTDDVNALVTDGTITPDVAERLVRSLDSAAASIAKNNTGSACSHLRTFVRRVEDEIDAGTIPATTGQTLIDHAEALQVEMGCS